MLLCEMQTHNATSVNMFSWEVFTHTSNRTYCFPSCELCGWRNKLRYTQVQVQILHKNVCFIYNYVFRWFLHANPCRIMLKLRRSLISDTEMCDFLQKVALWTCPDPPMPVPTCQGQSRRTRPRQQSKLSFFLRKYTFPILVNKFIIF